MVVGKIVENKEDLVADDKEENPSDRGETKHCPIIWPDRGEVMSSFSPNWETKDDEVDIDR